MPYCFKIPNIYILFIKNSDTFGLEVTTHFGLKILTHFGLRVLAYFEYKIHKDFELYQAFMYNFCAN